MRGHDPKTGRSCSQFKIWVHTHDSEERPVLPWLLLFSSSWVIAKIPALQGCSETRGPKVSCTHLGQREHAKAVVSKLTVVATPIILVLVSLRQNCCRFKASLGYPIVKPVLLSNIPLPHKESPFCNQSPPSQKYPCLSWVELSGKALAQNS